MVVICLVISNKNEKIEKMEDTCEYRFSVFSFHSFDTIRTYPLKLGYPSSLSIVLFSLVDIGEDSIAIILKIGEYPTFSHSFVYMFTLVAVHL